MRGKMRWSTWDSNRNYHEYLQPFIRGITCRRSDEAVFSSVVRTKIVYFEKRCRSYYYTGIFTAVSPVLLAKDMRRKTDNKLRSGRRFGNDLSRVVEKNGGEEA
jgi:hypothetical protein